MKIYTKTGDAGQTSICGGTRMSKDAPRIEAYGTVDELNSILGTLSTASDTPNESRALLLRIQNQLFNIGSFLAGIPEPGIKDEDITALEADIDRMDALLPPLRNFILPGGCALAAQAHVARAVCRRAERRIISVTPAINTPAIILTYMNRLSDWLYVLARLINYNAGISEHFWQKPI